MDKRERVGWAIVFCALLWWVHSELDEAKARVSTASSIAEDAQAEIARLKSRVSDLELR